MTECPHPPSAPAIRALAVLLPMRPQLEPPTARAPAVARELRTISLPCAGSKAPLFQQHPRCTTARAEYFAALGRLAVRLSCSPAIPCTLFIHIDLLEEEFQGPTPESPTVMQQTLPARSAWSSQHGSYELVQDYPLSTCVSSLSLRLGPCTTMGAAVQAWAARCCSRHCRTEGDPGAGGPTTVGAAGDASYPSAPAQRARAQRVVQNAIGGDAQWGHAAYCVCRTRHGCTNYTSVIIARNGHPCCARLGLSRPLRTPPSRAALGWASIFGRRFSSAHLERGVAVESRRGAGHDLCPDVFPRPG